MRKIISKKRLNNRRRVKKTRRHNMKGGATPLVKSVDSKIVERNGKTVKQIVLYALSANPPTKAHTNIIEQLAEKYAAVFVWASTNWLKIDPTQSVYDPLYKPEDTRSEFLQSVLSKLDNVKVDYVKDNRPKYNHVNTGISVKKFIDANLESKERITIHTDDTNIHLNQFKLKSTEVDLLTDDVNFLKHCGIMAEDTVELWVSFGLDVVRDTPTWTPNNAFLTKATGILMIPRIGEGLGDGLFSYVYNPDPKVTYCKLPFLDRTTLNKDTGARALRTFDFTQESMLELNGDANMKDLVDSLLNDPIMNKLLVIYMQTKVYNEFQAKLLKENEDQLTPDGILTQLERISQENKEKLKPLFNDMLNKLDKKFLLLIEDTKITLDEAFSKASSTLVRKMAIHIGLGGKVHLKPELLSLVDGGGVMEQIISTYGTPTIAEQLAIVIKQKDGVMNSLQPYIVLYENLTKHLNALKKEYLVNDRYTDTANYILLTAAETAAKAQFEIEAEKYTSEKYMLREAVLRIMNVVE
jgi:nicotinic acid mononucleotide adenylyltransferase